MDSPEQLRTDRDRLPTTTPSDGAEDSLQDSPESYSTKRELRKILREESKWSMKSIAITALTGVSVAVIATQLNGLVSSMVLIAVMAFITASVSEIYRVFIGLTGLGARKAAAKAARLLPIVNSAEPKQPRDEEDSDPITEAMQVITSAYKLKPEQEADRPGLFKRFSYRMGNYGKANPFLWLVVLFLGIAVTTVAVTYLVTDGQPPQIIQRTVEVAQPLSEDERSSIVAEAKAQALAELRAEPSPAKVYTAQSVLDELNSLSARLLTMETELKGLATDDPSPTPNPGDQQALLDRITKLETEREALTKKLAELEAKIPAGTGGPAASNGTASLPTASPTR